jgi:hypothetical protein
MLSGAVLKDLITFISGVIAIIVWLLVSGGGTSILDQSRK